MAADQTLLRIAQGLANPDDHLFNDMLESLPEPCRPNPSEIDDSQNSGCLTMLAIIGKTALMVECGAVSAEDALAEIATLNTCDDCPLKTFD